MSRRPLWGHGWIGGHGDLPSLALSSESPFCSRMSQGRSKKPHVQGHQQPGAGSLVAFASYHAAR